MTRQEKIDAAWEECVRVRQAAQAAQEEYRRVERTAVAEYERVCHEATDDPPEPEEGGCAAGAGESGGANMTTAASRIAVGLDVGTALGKGTMMAVINLDGSVTFYRCASQEKRLLPRLREIRARVHDRLSDSWFDNRPYLDGVYAVECPIGKQGNARQVLGGFWFLVDLVSIDEPVYSVAPASLKKFCADKGSADKAQVATAVTRQWGCLLPEGRDLDVDEADALGLALMALCAAGEPNPNGKPWTAYQLDAVKKLEAM